MTKPWDSPENLALTEDQCPAAFQCPTDPNVGRTTNTSYLGVVGPGMFFNGAEPRKISDITDGMSRTISVVEVMGSTVHWSEPRDIGGTTVSFQMNRTPDQIGSDHPSGAHAGYADGSVRMLRETTPPESIKAQYTIAGDDNHLVQGASW